MKSYTDLEQSKKLAKFLPLDSADYCWGLDDETLHYNSSPYPCAWKDYSCKEYYVPCWSLASLIDILPQFIEFKGDKYYLKFMKEYVEYANDEVSITGRCLHTTGNDNLVDACYEFILKLHELNLL